MGGRGSSRATPIQRRPSVVTGEDTLAKAQVGIEKVVDGNLK
jgi:hypothetical protein